ncbi:MAG: glycosyltransferase family 4 protein [Acidobacteriota bacterium]
MQNVAPHILLAAYQCGPGKGSVSQIGWEWYSRLARRQPTTLVTHVRNRDLINQTGAPWGGPEIIYIDTEWFAGPLYRLAVKLFPKSEHSVFLISSLDYFVHDYEAVKLLKRRLRQGERWDVVHVVTPVSTAAPTRLYQLGFPVVMGPLNAGMGTPAAFRQTLRGDSTWLYPIRYLGRLADWVIGSTRHAALLLTATRATLESIPARYRSRSVQMLENGVDLNRFTATCWPDPPSLNNPLKILFVGRLIPAKALPLLFQAIVEVRREFPVELTVVGDGPMEQEWKQKALALGLEREVFFAGGLSLDQVAEHMRAAHVFCLPSVRESGGAVLLEAMASAKPVIAVAFGGPAEIVDEGVGRAIAPDGPDAVTAGFANALRDVFRNPDRWRQRGLEGRRRAEQQFCWDAKITAAIQLYQQVMKQVMK